jgi:hypothetical protein
MNKKIITILSLCIVLLPAIAFAATDGVYNITVDNIGFAGGELSGDGTYGLMDTIGEPVVGVGSSEDYETQAGFWYMVNNTLSLVLDSNTEDLGTVVAGTPNAGSTVATVTTDAWGGYDLLISQNHDMQHTVDAGTTIPSFTGTIATPASWTNGVDVGLGFTVSDGTDIEVKWGTTPNFNYAGIPGTDTVFHEKTGYTSGGDDTTVAYKIDVDSTQRSGTYENTVTFTAISKL